MNNEMPRTSFEQEAGEKRPFGARLWGMVSHNWGWKLTSLVLAVCLWGGLISQDTSLPRDKVIDDVRVAAVNASALRSNGFIVVSGLEEAESVRIRARVPQRNYASASAVNYTARLDLSQIQAPGIQTLNVTAMAANAAQYGTVTEIFNSEVTLMVEELESQTGVPVEVRLTGTLEDDYFVSSLTRGVDAVDISGPKSVVDKAVRCVVLLDQSGLSPERSPNAASLPFFFEDAEGNALDGSNLTVTAQGQTAPIQRISVSQDVYYLARVPMDESALVVGEPEEGFAVSSVRVTPQTIVIAGSKGAVAPYLEAGASLYPYEQVNISGQNRTVSQLLYLNTPGNVEYISNNAVQVVVTIVPKEFVDMNGNRDAEQNP